MYFALLLQPSITSVMVGHLDRTPLKCRINGTVIHLDVANFINRTVCG